MRPTATLLSSNPLEISLPLFLSANSLEGRKREGDVGVNANYLSHASSSVISSSLACLGMSPNLHLSLTPVKHQYSLHQRPLHQGTSRFLDVAAYHYLNHSDRVKEFYFVLIIDTEKPPWILTRYRYTGNPDRNQFILIGGWVPYFLRLAQQKILERNRAIVRTFGFWYIFCKDNQVKFPIEL